MKKKLETPARYDIILKGGRGQDKGRDYVLHAYSDAAAMAAAEDLRNGYPDQTVIVLRDK